MKSLYETDTYAWTLDQVDHLKKKEIDMLDWENLIEEIESLGRSEKHGLKSHLNNLLMHQLKTIYQPEKHSPSWNRTIKNCKIEIKHLLKESPSLKTYFKKIFLESYADARELASEETEIELNKFPEKCPWTVEEILGEI